MVLSVNAAWMAAAKSTPLRPVYLVTLRWGTGTTDGVDQYTIASRHGYGCAASLSDAGAIGVAVDVSTRSLTFSTFQLSVRRDPLMRKLVSTKPMKGKQAVIKLGFVGLAAANFVTVATMRVIDAVPDATGAQIKCGPVAFILNDARMKLQFTNKHPLQAIAKILQHTPLSTAQYDATTLDPANHPTISHWNLSRQERTGSQGYEPYGQYELEKTSARDLLGGLLKLLDGTFLPNENGVHRFKRYDINAMPARTWTRKDIIDFKPLTLWENLRNQVTARYGRGTDFQYTFTMEDAISQAFFAYPGETAHVETEPFETDWINSIGTMEDPLPTPADGTPGSLYATGTNFRVLLAGINGFSGARYNPNTEPSFTIDSHAQLGSGRSAYLMLTGKDRRRDFQGSNIFNNDHPEVVKIASVAVNTPTGAPPTIEGAGDVGFDVARYPRWLRFTIDTAASNGGRAQFETVPLIPYVWRGAIVTDVTLLADRAARILRRQAYGLRTIEVRTNLREYDIEVGDFMAFDDDTYLDFGYDGTAAGIVWEVISKEVRALDDSPGIVWQLAFVRADAVPVNTPTWVPTESGYVSVGATGCPLYAHDGTVILSGTGDPMYARNC